MVHRSPTSGYILGLDVGEKRIGVALASAIAKLPQPQFVIPGGEKAIEAIKELAKKENVNMIVVGLPRNLHGDETSQSRRIRDFADRLSKAAEQPVVFAEESLSSVRADELSKNTEYKNVSRDSLAACFILEEYLMNHDTTDKGD